MRQLPPFLDRRTALATEKVIHALYRYHSYRVDGIEHIGGTGPLLLVVHHSLATYDIALLGYSIFEHTGRLPRALADRLIFQIAPLAHLVRGLGGVEGHPQAARALLANGDIVMVAPGGMREAVRPSTQKYSISWEGRLGFARLALEAGVPIVPAACPAADDLYEVYPSRLTDFVLQRFHFPLPLARGIGPTLLPRRRALVHHVGAPIVPPPAAPDPAVRQAQVRQLQKAVADAMRTLLRAST